MRLQGITVGDFRCVASASVEFGPGLNVLHGPNDLGKSTIATALRAGLLLLHGSSVGRSYVPWGTQRKPEVQIRFEVDGRTWRVSKTFAQGSGGSSLLEWSPDGEVFSKAEEGRAVDGEVRRLLGWGIDAPGGKKRQSGLPRSFLSSVLLGEQALPYRLFDETLERDDNDTGRQRLTEALQALATDPLYQQVLDAAQAQVDAAFDSRGKPRSGRNSPFRGVADEIKRRHAASEDLDRKVADADAVAARLAELDAERDRWMTRRSAAHEGLAAAQRDHDLGERRTALTRQVAQAQGLIDEIERNRDEMQRLTAERKGLQSDLPAAQAEVDAAAGQRAEAQDARSRARQKLEAVREGGDAEGRAAVAKLQQRRAELEGDVKAAQRAVDAGVAWQHAVQHQVECDAAAAAAQAEVETARAQAQRRQQHTEALQHDVETLRAAEQWLRLCRAREAVEKADAAGRDVGLKRDRAAAQRAQAQASLAAVQARELPDAARLAQLRAIRDELAVLRARLGGGVSVQLRLAKSRTIEARIDGDDPRPFPAGATFEAQREVVIDLGRTGTIEIVGGEAEARRAAASVQARYDDVVAPVLQRCGAEDLDALAALVVAADSESAEARGLDAEAATLLRLIEAHDDGALEAARAQLAVAEQAVGETPTGEVQARAEQHGEDALQAALEEAEDRLRSHARETEAASRGDAEGQAAARVAQERARAAASAVDDAAAALGAEPSLEAAASAERLAAAQTAQGEVDAQLEALQATRGDAVARAEQACAAAEATHAKAEAAEAKVRKRVEKLRRELERAAAALEVRKEQAKGHDAFAAAEAFAKCSDDLQALPEPQRDVSEEMVAAATTEVEGAEQRLEDALSELRKQEGALQQVGGQVIREKADAAREALEAARRRQAEVELDYEGWRMLRDALREAENEEGQHLGRALGKEVGDRFEALTQGRYGALQLGPDLQAQKLQTAAGTQEINALSEGLKEQLATILRVSIAQHLRGVLVLDDHLAQTDPARSSWFVEMLADAAKDIQIILLTCRPDDYLRAGVDAIHAVDLSQVIERVGV